MHTYQFFIDSKNYNKLEGFALVSYLSKAKLLVDLSLLLTLIVSCLFFYRYIFLHVETLSLAALLVTPCLLMLGLFYLKKTGDIRFQSWLLLILTITVLPLRAYYTGGVIAPNFTWFAAGIVVIGAIHSKKVLFTFSIVLILQLIALHYMVTPEYVTTLAARAIIHTTGLGVILYTLLSISKIGAYVASENKRMERFNTINLMIMSLSHEINNPLAIAKGNLNFIKKNASSDKEILDRVDKIDKSLDRIDKVIKDISALNESGKVKTEPYATGGSIISLND